MTGSDYGPVGEAKLKRFVEQVTGGHVESMARQVRWRPAWFVDVVRGGERLSLYVRGERGGDVMPFPELRREAEIIDELHRGGVPVPRIHGYCADPPAIVMESLRGARDVSLMASDRDRSVVARQYIAAIAAMHRLPVDGFAARGIAVPEGEEAIALAGLDAYTPLYRRAKRRPEPLIEFAIRWLRRNRPKGRDTAALVQFDAGQFLFKDGRLTGLYDFEFAMIGDPLADLATMRMRESTEPLGEDMRMLVRHYERETGHPIDHDALDFHTLVFSTVATMQFAGAVAEMTLGAPHAVYLEFDLALRQTLIMNLATCMRQPVPGGEVPIVAVPRHDMLIKMVADAAGQIVADDPLGQSRKQALADLIEYLGRSDAMSGEVERRNRADAEALLGARFIDWPEAEAALERYVLAAGEDDDRRLFDLFARQEARKLAIFGPTRIGRSAAKAFIPAARWEE